MKSRQSVINNQTCIKSVEHIASNSGGNARKVTKSMKEKKTGTPNDKYRNLRFSN